MKQHIFNPRSTTIHIQETAYNHTYTTHIHKHQSVPDLQHHIHNTIYITTSIPLICLHQYSYTTICADIYTTTYVQQHVYNNIYTTPNLQTHLYNTIYIPTHIKHHKYVKMHTSSYTT